jgi:hypothetical protein
LRYWVDDQDRLAEVDDEWRKFAIENGAPQLASSSILGRTMGSFCSDPTTREIWAYLFARARAGVEDSVRLRCDAPAKLRLLELSVAPDHGRVRVSSVELWTEDRPGEPLLTVDRARSSELLSCCSWCKKWESSSGIWVEAASLISSLRLFERDSLPGVTHGICSACAVAQRKQRRHPTTG